MPQARERAAASLLKRAPVLHEAREQIGQKRTREPPLFCRDDARFAEQVTRIKRLLNLMLDDEIAVDEGKPRSRRSTPAGRNW